MNLFQPRVVTNALEHVALPIPDPHAALLNNWRASITSGAILGQKETALHGHFIQKILIELLGYTGFGVTPEWTLQREQHIGKGSVDVALGRFTDSAAQILAVLELKGADTKNLDAIMPGRHKSPVQQAWEYAMDAKGAKWVLVSNYLELRLYAVGYGRQDYETWKLAELLSPHEYARFRLLLSADHLLSGQTWELLEESERAEKDITNALYQDYKTLREKLIATLKQDNPAVAELDVIAYAQTMLDRLLFIAFAEDQKLLPKNTLTQAFQHRDPYNPRPIWDNFKGLFQAIQSGNQALGIPAYNGGLFRPDDLPDSLIVADDLCQAFKELGEYDFASEVSVTILGHIFEQSITDLEALQAQAAGTAPAVVGKRKKEGVVYTPDTITRFIVEQTLGGYLTAQFDRLWTEHADRRKKTGEQSGQWKTAKDEIAFWRAYQDLLRQTTVVDPACGSGAFLVAAFEFLSEEYTRVNARLAELDKGQAGLFDLDKEILNRNLYGVDINGESIEITKLSLWLKTAKCGKVLNSLDHNLRVGDSLECQNLTLLKAAGDASAFRWQTAFPEVFERGGFDVVLGNPPYVRQEFIAHLKPALQAQYAVYNGVADLYTYFFERGVRLLKPGGKLGYIASSTFFKTGSGVNLRRYLTEHAAIEAIVDFGDRQVFEGVTTYPAIVVLANTTPDETHAVHFLTLKNTPEDDLSKAFQTQAATMPQTALTEDGWRLEDDASARLRKKILAGKKTLKEVYGSPFYGIKTGFNEAFVIDREKRDELVAADPKSIEILKSFLEGEDLKKWHVEPKGKWLIFFPCGCTVTHSNCKEKTTAWLWLKEEYPIIAEYLEPFALKAEARWDKGDFWWELRACAYYPEFEKPKIIYPVISQGAKFSVDTSGSFSNDKTFFLPKFDLFLLGILNSKVCWFYLLGICSALRGGVWRLELRSQYIETIPIPNTTDAQKAAIADLAQRCQQTAEARYAAQDAVRRRIPDLCPAGRESKLNTKLSAWWTLDFAAFRAEIKKCFKADIPLTERNAWETWLATECTKIKDISQTLAALEDELNRLVYALFDLPNAEIALLEQAIQ